MFSIAVRVWLQCERDLLNLDYSTAERGNHCLFRVEGLHGRLPAILLRDRGWFVMMVLGVIVVDVI